MERGWSHLLLFMYNPQPWTLSNEKSRLGNFRNNMLSLNNQTRNCWKLYRGWFFFQNTELNNKITIICISDFERVMDIVFCSPQMYPPNILQFILLYDDVRYLTTVWRFSNLPRHNFISAMVQVMFVLSYEAKHEIVWWSDHCIRIVAIDVLTMLEDGTLSGMIQV